MNQFRQQILAHSRKHVADIKMADMLATPKGGVVFDPPKPKDINTLVDWIADHPSAKASKSLRFIQEAYLESLGIL